MNKNDWMDCLDSIQDFGVEVSEVKMNMEEIKKLPMLMQAQRAQEIAGQVVELIATVGKNLAAVADEVQKLSGGDDA